MMHPEVHTLVDVNLRWSGVEAQCSPNAMEAHSIFLEPSHQDRRPDHYGPLRAITQPVQSFGQAPQINWRLPRNPQSH
jgi:hypothetical protein